MTFQIEGALYPDVEPPGELTTLADQVDFLARHIIHHPREVRLPALEEGGHGLAGLGGVPGVARYTHTLQTAGLTRRRLPPSAAPRIIS